MDGVGRSEIWIADDEMKTTNEILWCPNWYATRLHAVTDSSREHPQALCGAMVLYEPAREFAKRRLAKGVKRCATCQRMLDNDPNSSTRKDAR